MQCCAGCVAKGFPSRRWKPATASRTSNHFVIGDARIVSLGEAKHGTREFFQLKHRLLDANRGSLVPSEIPDQTVLGSAGPLRAAMGKKEIANFRLGQCQKSHVRPRRGRNCQASRLIHRRRGQSISPHRQGARKAKLQRLQRLYQLGDSGDHVPIADDLLRSKEICLSEADRGRDRRRLQSSVPIRRALVCPGADYLGLSALTLMHAISSLAQSSMAASNPSSNACEIEFNAISRTL
jgi:hypothetical protein